jgi:hypothetical protein
MVPYGSGEMVLEVWTFNPHAEFTTDGPNSRVGPAAITCISVGLAFQTTIQFNPTSTTASMVQPSVLEVSSTSLSQIDSF